MPQGLSGGDAERLLSSVDRLVDFQASQLEEVVAPPVGRNGKPLSKKDANLKGVQASLAQPVLRPRKKIEGEELARQAEKLLPSVWVMRKRKLKGEALSFLPREINARTMNRVRPFLEQPLNDDAREKGYRKARQMGLSENSVSEVLWFLDTHHHTKAFYTFPTNRQMQDFSNTRIAEAIQESDHLQSVMGDIKNVNLKKVGSSYLFLRGSQTERLGEGVDADVAFFDEIDRMPPRVKVAFEESLQGSLFGWVREISTPTVPNHGIDEGWNKSKQWYWFIKCSKCNTKQTLEWLPTDDFAGKVSIVVTEGIHVYACRKCERELSLEDRIRGEWVAKFPRREPSYYQFSQLMAPWITAEKLYQKQEDYPLKQLFFNYCLGIPYLGDNVLVTEEGILACRTHIPRDRWKGSRVLGIDWGDRSWIVVLQALPDGKVGLVHLERIESADVDEIVGQVAQCFEKFGAAIMVNDAGYGKDRNTMLLKRFPDRVFSCFYPNVEKGSKIFEPQWQDESHKVSLDRTTSIKLALGLFRMKQVVIAPEIDLMDLRTFTKHLTNLVSVKDYDEKTGVIEEWIASTGQDHFGHAWNYAATALQKLAKLPKSECWDWNSAVAEARRSGEIKPSERNNAQPGVPGFMPIKDLVESSGGMANVRPDKQGCYAVKYAYDQNVCGACTLQRSCKSICDGRSGEM